MGVHNLSVYTEIKKLLEIPEDEPIFILRAQDILYPAAIGAYQALFMSALIAGGEDGLRGDRWAFTEHLDACRNAGRRWQTRNSDKVKVPD